MRFSLCFLIVIATLAGLSAACDVDGERSDAHAGHEHAAGSMPDVGDHGELHVFEAAALIALDGQPLLIESPVGFRQVGILFDADGVDSLVVRGRTSAGFTEPVSAEITWREGRLYVARVLLDETWEALEIADTSGITHLRIDLHEDLTVDPSSPLARELPFETIAPREEIALTPDGTAVHTITAAIDEPSWVVSRSSWGARSPTYICGDRHTPTRMTVHHTVTGTPDGSSAPARMRQMQAFHIDGNGWCDIGYHFVVGHDGNVYEARRSHEHIGTHVGGANTNNVGVSYMGTFTSIVPPDSMMNAGGRIIGWLATTYGIALNRTNVRGHRDFGGTSCPGDALYPNLDRLIGIAAGGEVVPEPEPTYDVAIDVNYLGLSNPLTSGSSATLSDVFPGDTFQAEILITNNSSTVIRNVEIGYWFEQPYLSATNWAIYTDWPAKDRATWVINSADGEAANPARNALGAEGRLLMHAFSVGETKRVVLDLVAGEPSIGRADHPDVRAWLRNVSDVYGVQEGFSTDPSTNRIGRNVRNYEELDVLSRAGWIFNSTLSDADTEGFDACADTLEAFRLNTTDGMLAAQVRDALSCVVSPGWTQIDADRFDSMVLDTRSYDGVRTAELRWARAGESFDESRSVRFATAGDGLRHELVVPVGEHPQWSGTITQLQWLPAGPETTASDVSRWYDTGHLYFQASTDRAVSHPAMPYVDSAPVALVDDVEPSPDVVEPVPDAGMPDAGVSDTGFVDAGADSSAEVDVVEAPDNSNSDIPSRDEGVVESEAVTVRSPSCGAAPGSASFAMAFVLFALRRRRFAQ